MSLRYILMLSICSSWVLFSKGLFAQIDTTSSVLLKSRSSQGIDVESSRYTIKKDSNESDPVKYSIVEKVVGDVQEKKQAPPKEKTEVNSNDSLKAEKVSTSESESNQNINDQKEDKENIKGQLSELVLGAEWSEVGSIKKRMNARDPRQNIFTVSVSPLLLYIDVDSTSWYKRYSTSSIGLATSARLNPSPFLSFLFNYKNTFGGSILATPGATTKQEIDFQFMSLGLEFHKLFGYSLNSPTLSFGINYFDNSYLVPKDSTNRIRSSSRGLDLGVNLKLPKSRTYWWTLGAKIQPNISLSEEATALDFKSGTGNTANAVGLSVGGEFLLDRFSQVYWKLSHKYETSLFQGASSANDPVTGSTLSAIHLNQSLTLFELGFVWGK